MFEILITVIHLKKIASLHLITELVCVGCEKRQKE